MTYIKGEIRGVCAKLRGTMLSRLICLGVAVMIGTSACSQEVLQPASASQASSVQTPQDEEARRQELIDRFARETATEEDRLRAEQGDSDAQALLAVVYFNGRGVDVDYEEALRWARLAADQGHARGQSILAAAYFNGFGVERDYTEAARWARPAAEAGRAGPQVILGTLYMNGHGVEQDFVSAYMWLTLVANNRDAASGGRLIEFLTARMTPEQLEEARRRVRDWRPRQ